MACNWRYLYGSLDEKRNCPTSYALLSCLGALELPLLSWRPLQSLTTHSMAQGPLVSASPRSLFDEQNHEITPHLLNQHHPISKIPQLICIQFNQFEKHCQTKHPINQTNQIYTHTPPLCLPINSISFKGIDSCCSVCKGT